MLLCFSLYFIPYRFLAVVFSRSNQLIFHRFTRLDSLKNSTRKVTCGSRENFFLTEPSLHGIISPIFHPGGFLSDPEKCIEHELVVAGFLACRLEP